MKWKSKKTLNLVFNLVWPVLQPSRPPMPASEPLRGNASVDDGRWALSILDLAATRSASFNCFDNLHRLAIPHLTEHDVLAVKPAGDDSRDKELRPVAIEQRQHETEKVDK